MDVTAREAHSFLEQQGFKEEYDGAIETRGRRKARETADTLTSTHVRQVTLESYEIEAEKKQLKMVFRLFDKNKRGALSLKQLAAAFESLGRRPARQKLEKIFKTLDKDKNGVIDCNEFVEYMIKKQFKKKRTPRSSRSPTRKRASPTRRSSGSRNTSPTRSRRLKRNKSITNFYTEYAGLQEIPSAPVDENKNPIGRAFDLGVEGAFTDFKILVLDRPQFSFPLSNRDSPAERALKSKGFQVDVVNSEQEFIRKLPNVHQAWIIGGRTAPYRPVNGFVEAVVKFHDEGKGLFIWGEDDLYDESNAVLDKILDMQLTGNDHADGIMTPGDPTMKGHFGSHLLTSGIVTLAEGITICYPTNTNKVQPLATSSYGHVCMAYAEPAGKGRVVIDCGWTKLRDPWWSKTPGTERWVRNAAVWLLNLENTVGKLNEGKSDDYRTLERGMSFAVEESLAAQKITVGMGWKSAFDLDVSLLVYDTANALVETIYFGNLKSKNLPIVHSGDILVGGKSGDLETITLELQKMPANIKSLMFAVTVYTPGKTFAEVQRAYARMLDDVNDERCRFTLDKEHFGNHAGLVMCKVFRPSDGIWRMVTIGETVNSRTAQDMHAHHLLDKYLKDDWAALEDKPAVPL